MTAGASGIGNCIARSFLEHGASVHVVDIDASGCDALCDEIADARLYCSVADVSDAVAVSDVFARQKKQFGGIDVLVNCAGIKGPTDAVENVEVEAWRECVAVNLDSTFLCSRSAVAMMKSEPDGMERRSIVSMSSTAGWHGYANRSAYAAAKWGVIGFTKSIAMELGPVGIRANAICPGSVSGARMDRVIADEAAKLQISEDAVRKNYTNGVSLRSFIEPEDVAAMALFLSSPAASRVTGQAISVDGHLENFGGAN